MRKTPICPGRWERLLVCTDGSPNSQVAVDETLTLAHLCGSMVYLVQVLQIFPEFEAVAPDLRARLAELVQTQMETVKAEAARMGVALEARILASVSPFSAILEEAKKIHPDLIIMGRYGRTGLSRLMMGSVTSRVIGYSSVNVLVIPLGATLAFGRLLIASDGSPCSAVAWEEALAIAKQANSELLAVSVARKEGELTVAREIAQRLLGEAKQKGVPLETRVLLGEPDEAIVEEALRNQVELIIVGSHGRTGLKKLLVGSVTERVIGQAPCAVLVVKRFGAEET